VQCVRRRGTTSPTSRSSHLARNVSCALQRLDRARAPVPASSARREDPRGRQQTATDGGGVPSPCCCPDGRATARHRGACAFALDLWSASEPRTAATAAARRVRQRGCSVLTHRAEAAVIVTIAGHSSRPRRPCPLGPLRRSQPRLTADLWFTTWEQYPPAMSVHALARIGTLRSCWSWRGHRAYTAAPASAHRGRAG
jgi:hypothetical protein